MSKALEYAGLTKGQIEVLEGYDNDRSLSKEVKVSMIGSMTSMFIMTNKLTELSEQFNTKLNIVIEEVKKINENEERLDRAETAIKSLDNITDNLMEAIAKQINRSK